MRMLKRSALALPLLGGLAAAALAATPVTAQAQAGAQAGTSSASVRVVTGGFLQLDYVGSADANNVLIMLESGTNAVRINDSVSIVPGPGCVQAPGDATTVRCSVGISRIGARLGAGADTFTSLVPLTGTVEGDAGDDLFRPSRSDGNLNSRIMYVGGAGVDTATYQGVPATGPTGGTGVRVTLDGQANDGRDATASRPADQDNVQTENLIGSSAADNLTGDRFANRLTGGNGRDSLSGGLGNDVLDLRDQAADQLSFCGDGIGDTAFADRAALDPVSVDCETVERAN
ncbi:hypothetical protein AB0C28_51955 [Nonomuraea sp. NPDC048892]|uniref:hypothetical protein n=1 Tax=Nonomuraea sp. NPDC048892 TaxID=3154624 RepID=UPI0033C7FADB